MVEQTADHILVTDPQGVILYVNSAFERVTGYTRVHAVGQTPRLLKSGRHTRAFYEKLWQTMLAGETFRGTSVNRKKDGSFYYEDKVITPIKDASGKIIYLISIGQDVTERIKSEEGLEASEAALKIRVESLVAINAIADSVHRSLSCEAFIQRATEAIVQDTQAPSAAFFVLKLERWCWLLRMGFPAARWKSVFTLPTKAAFQERPLPKRVW